MSDKSHANLDRADRALRESSPVGMEDGVKQLVVRRAGFELSNSRPYHNYETWSDEYEVLGRRDGKAMTLPEAAELLLHGWRPDSPHLSVRMEDLDDACARFAQEVAKEKATAR